MGANVPLWLPLTLILLASLSAACAVVAWLLAFRSTPSRSSKREPPPTAPSDGRLARLEAEQAAFSSALESQARTIKRLSSKYWKDAERAADAPPAPAQETKQQLRLRLLHGKTHQQIAALHQNIPDEE